MGEFRRSHSKVWWGHYPEDSDTMSPSLPSWGPGVQSPSLPGWGPGVPLSPDRGSPSNGSHKSQDSGFSDSENSPKPSEDSPDSPDEEKKSVPRLLSDTPARIPRVCLSRYRTSRTLNKCLNSTWGGREHVPVNQRFNQSDCILSVYSDDLSAEEARTSFVVESDDDREEKSLPKTVNSESNVKVVSLNSTESSVQDSSDSSVSTSENQTALFIPKPSPKFRPRSPQSIPPSPITSRPSSPGFVHSRPSSPGCVHSRPSSPKFVHSRPSSPGCVHSRPSSPGFVHSRPSSPGFVPTPLSARVPSWDAELDVLGAPVHCSTPKTVPSSRVQPRGSRVTRRPVNLNKNFESVALPPPPPPPVQQWCRELRLLCEPECMTTLQSKSLTADLSRQVTLMAATTTEAVRTLQMRTRTISHEFTKLYRKVDQSQLEHVGPLVQSLLGHMTELLAVVEGGDCCGRLLTAAERLRSAAGAETPQQQQLMQGVTELGRAFTGVVDHLLAQQIKLLVAVLEEPSSTLALLSALSALSGLGLEASHLGDLLSHCSGVRALLALCLDSKSTSVRTAALRILATVCCSCATIRQFEQGGGVEIISDIIADERRGETEVTEAVSVLAQITAPWVEDNHSVLGLTEQLTQLVAALTRLVNNTTSSVLLLLSAAAVCHLSLLEPQCVWRLLDCKTAGTLLLAVRRQGPHASVFLQEQVAGLLANMAAVPEARPHLAQHRAVVALLCFLQVRHCPLQRAPEIAAAERLQHKSAIALSRLCSDPNVAAQVVELQGIDRLVRLCKEERERNNSDGVLVACLAALRKIVANCGLEVMDALNARELVEPRLLDSFFLYSSRQESYV